jgi:UDP-glucose 4-epimerase
MFTTPHTQFITKVLEHGIGKYIFVSSGGSIYGKNETGVPFKEGDRLNPLSFYGESKKIQEGHLTSECIRLNIPYVILRPSNVFNSYTDGTKHSGLIGVWLQRFMKKESLDLFGPATITKDYITNEDVAISILKSMNLAENKIINIGSGIPVTTEEILRAFENTFEFVAEKTLKPMSADDIPWMVLDVKKAETVLNFRSSINVLDWISTSRNNLRNR